MTDQDYSRAFEYWKSRSRQEQDAMEGRSLIAIPIEHSLNYTTVTVFDVLAWHARQKDIKAEVLDVLRDVMQVIYRPHYDTGVRDSMQEATIKKVEQLYRELLATQPARP